MTIEDDRALYTTDDIDIVDCKNYWTGGTAMVFGLALIFIAALAVREAANAAHATQQAAESDGGGATDFDVNGLPTDEALAGWMAER